ncbi:MULTISPECIES: hypothetical protein [unclassified Burkholderia]|uniref:hypothetical protein n=1 Tax=unclassified Burkholderia TaxID=2613784 RepID=UPI001FC8158C|nr:MULTISPECIES: hypothetical protein [unclassified Burkholderia]
MVQTEAGRVRVGEMAVRLSIGRTWADLAAAIRALDGFDAYCVVSESMRAGIPISVDVCDASGVALECTATGA